MLLCMLCKTVYPRLQFHIQYSPVQIRLKVKQKANFLSTFEVRSELEYLSREFS